MVEFLIQKNANVTLKDDVKSTALHMACIHGNFYQLNNSFQIHLHPKLIDSIRLFTDHRNARSSRF